MHRSTADLLYSVRTALGGTTLILGAWYAALVWIHSRTIAESSASWIVGAAALTAFVFAACGLRWIRRPPHESSVDASVAFIVFTILANDAVYLFFRPEPQYLHGLAVVLMGAGLFLVSRVWFAMIAAGVVGVVVATVSISNQIGEWTQPVILLASIGMFAIVIHFWRGAYLERLEFLRRQSEERRLELAQSMAALADHHDQLETLVEERTNELVVSRDKLREAERLAAVGTLTAGIAHQINNPIGAILVTAEYALLSEDDHDVNAVWKNALQSNLDEARRCGSIVRGLLQFARNDPTEKSVEDLNLVAQRAHRAIRPYAHDHSAEVNLHSSEIRLPVFMSSIEIEQVLINVIRNSIESLISGGRVEVHAEKQHAHALLRVTDNGKGIDSGNLGRVFDPFFSTRLGEGGTGLGLSVAHGIVHDHGGEISVESELGEGTTVVIQLPLDTR